MEDFITAVINCCIKKKRFTTSREGAKYIVETYREKMTFFGVTYFLLGVIVGFILTIIKISI